MKQTEETKQLECGCKKVVTVFKNAGPIQQQHWAESISLEDLEHGMTMRAKLSKFYILLKRTTC